MPSNKARVIEAVCRHLANGDMDDAATVARTQYPFVSAVKQQRRYTERRMARIFLRDGFIDRYSGERLVFPGTLRLLSKLMPNEFPAHPNWKVSESHLVYWELFPTIDHVIPVARGGLDDESNWVTTSMLRNSAKAHWTLAELGWQLQPAGSAQDWDGMTSWFVAYTEAHPDVVVDAYLRKWRAAAVACSTSGAPLALVPTRPALQQDSEIVQGAVKDYENT